MASPNVSFGLTLSDLDMSSSRSLVSNPSISEKNKVIAYVTTDHIDIGNCSNTITGRSHQ